VTDRRTVPPDPALPQLPSLLEPDLVAGILGRSLEQAPDVHVEFLRYRPGRRVVVGYEVKLGESAHQAFAWADARTDLVARAAAPESTALVSKVEGRTPTRAPLTYEHELGALLQWLPLDLALPAMAEPPEELHARVAAAGLELGTDDVVRVVKHKPMVRGVLRLDHHIAKAFPDEESLAASVHGLEASASLPFPTARCTAVVPDLLLAAQSLVPGRRPDGAAEVASQAGALLAALHAEPRDNLASELPGDRLPRAARNAKLLATVLPALAPRLNRLLTRLEAGLPAGELVTSHGGFHISQLLESDGKLGVVDFDGMCRAPAALDIASYIASGVERPEDLARVSDTLDVLVAAYGRRPTGVRWYLAAHLLARARRPFARFIEGWPEAVERRVAAAEQALELS